MKNSASSRNVVSPQAGFEIAEKIDASVERAKLVSRDLHEVIADGRSLVREIKVLLQEQRDTILSETGRIDKVMDAAVSVQIAQLAEATARAISDSVAKVGREFDRLAEIYTNHSQTEHEDSLRSMFIKRAKLDKLIGQPVAIASDWYKTGQVIVNHQGLEFTMGEDCKPLDVLYPHRDTGRLFAGPAL